MKRAVMQMLFLSIEVMGELKSKTKMRNITRQCSVENPSGDIFSREVCITNLQRITLCVQKQTKSLLTDYFRSTTDGRKRGDGVISLLRKLNLYAADALSGLDLCLCSIRSERHIMSSAVIACTGAISALHNQVSSFHLLKCLAFISQEMPSMDRVIIW